MDSYATRIHEVTSPLPPRVSYVIAATPRTGSTLLAELLGDTGLAGQPAEFFHPFHEKRFKRALGADSFPEYVDAIIRQRRSPNGVIGIKIVWQHVPTQVLPRFRTLPGMAGVPDAELLGWTFAHIRYVFLRRRDKVRQAISLDKARQTRLWHQRDDTPVQPVTEPQFDHERIQGYLQTILQEEDNWLLYFREAGVTPLEIFYEELIENPLQTVRRVLDYLGLTYGSDLAAGSNLRKQANEVNDEWARRYEEMASVVKPVPALESRALRSDPSMAP